MVIEHRDETDAPRLEAGIMLLTSLTRLGNSELTACRGKP